MTIFSDIITIQRVLYKKRDFAVVIATNKHNVSGVYRGSLPSANVGDTWTIITDGHTIIETLHAGAEIPIAVGE